MPFNNTPHLVVVRKMNSNDGTNLYEFWVIKSVFWYDEDAMREDPPVECYVAPWTGTGDTVSDGLPPEDRRAYDETTWQELPDKVREQFRDEARRISSAMEEFG